jgi:hypothetical protein
MTVTNSIEIVGLKETLKELNQLEPDLRKEFNRRYRNIVKPIVDDAKTNTPTLPLSGLARNWQKGRLAPWNQAEVRRSIISKVDTRRTATTVMKVTMKSAAGSVFDMAGRRTNNQLATSLQRFGSASRLMWAAYNRRRSDLEANIQQLVKDLTDAVNQRLVR